MPKFFFVLHGEHIAVAGQRLECCVVAALLPLVIEDEGRATITDLLTRVSCRLQTRVRQPLLPIVRLFEAFEVTLEFQTERIAVEVQFRGRAGSAGASSRGTASAAL